MRIDIIRIKAGLPPACGPVPRGGAMFDQGPGPGEGEGGAGSPPLVDALARLDVVLCSAPRELPLRFAATLLRECALRGRLRGRVAIERWGVTEALEAVDDDGAVLCAVQRLPDSDYLAWEQALAAVPVPHRDRRDASRIASATAPWQRIVRLRPDPDGWPQLLAEDRCSGVTWRRLQRFTTSR
jgi:hypothetical protein